MNGKGPTMMAFTHAGRQDRKISRMEYRVANTAEKERNQQHFIGWKQPGERNRPAMQTKAKNQHGSCPYAIDQHGNRHLRYGCRDEIKPS